MFTSQQSGFSSKDSKAVTTYLTAFDVHLKHNDVYNWLKSLLKSDHHDHHLFEIIDREIIRVCQHAEDNTYSKHRLTYWTVDLHQAKLKLSVWCQIQSRLCKKLSITTIVKRPQHWDIIDSFSCTPDVVEEAIATLKKEIKAIHNTSHEKQQDRGLPPLRLRERKECQATNDQQNSCSHFVANN